VTLSGGEAKYLSDCLRVNDAEDPSSIKANISINIVFNIVSGNYKKFVLNFQSIDVYVCLNVT